MDQLSDKSCKKLHPQQTKLSRVKCFRVVVGVKRERLGEFLIKTRLPRNEKLFHNLIILRMD